MQTPSAQEAAMLTELDAALSSEKRYDESDTTPEDDNKQAETSMEPAYKILIADDHPCSGKRSAV